MASTFSKKPNGKRLKVNDDLDKCSVCSKLVARSEMLEHKNEHRVRCTVCLRTLSKPSDLKRHMEIHMGTDRPMAYKCQFCDKAFSRQYQGLRHEFEVHVKETKLNEFECPDCLKTFYTEKFLNQHKKTHEKALYSTTEEIKVCSICRDKIPISIYMDHKASHRVQCTICSKSYNRQSDLNRHLKKPHKENNSTSLLQEFDTDRAEEEAKNCEESETESDPELILGL